MDQIYKKTLINGMTVVVYPVATIPKVAIQLWYAVGSKDEQSDQKGLAHLLEHMIFKGTTTLSESDINLIAHKLSGSCNAFTSHDYTAYVFDLPKHHWAAALPLLADCMSNCTFKEDLLNSELKAVVQELKMYQDDYVSSLCEKLMGAMFVQHPYHYPIIGFKHDLYEINQKKLLDFYHHHYVPNNSTLVIVGDVDPHEAHQKVSELFSKIPAAPDYRKKEYALDTDIINKTVVLHRDVQQTAVVYAWKMPGLKSEDGNAIDMLSWILAEGKGSRLFATLVDDLKIASEVQTDIYELFDCSVLFVHVEPLEQEYIAQIESVVKKIVSDLGTCEVSQDEIQRAYKQMRMEQIGILENNQKMAYQIGMMSCAQRDFENIFAIFPYEPKKCAQDIKKLCSSHLTEYQMNKGILLPLSEEEKGTWSLLQDQSDKDDEKILSTKSRESTVEPGRAVHDIAVQEAAQFAYPKGQKAILPNGLTVLYCDQPHFHKIDIILELKAKHYYDPEELQGLINFMSEMMLEGTAQYDDKELAHAAESRGISIDVRAGSIVLSCLKEDVAFALHLLTQLVMHATFPHENVEKIREQIAHDIFSYWDNPSDFIGQLVREKVYAGHPYSKNVLGTKKSIKKITRADLLHAYNTFMSPEGAKIAIVGDVSSIDLMGILKKTLGNWQPRAIPDIVFPALSDICSQTISHTIARDQTILCFAGLSVTRLDQDYDALLIFDQLLTGGVLGSMSSHLFQLREQSGLFYTIGGSVVANADEQPGLVFIKTILSNDHLAQAKKLISKTMIDAKSLLVEEDILHARNALLNSMVDNFESGDGVAQVLLFLDRFHLNADYCDLRARQLQAIDAAQIKKAADRVLDLNKLCVFSVGR